jgi:hypothetical protein
MKPFAISCYFERDKEDARTTNEHEPGNLFTGKVGTDNALKVLRFTGASVKGTCKALMSWLDQQPLTPQERKQFLADLRDALTDFLLRDP